MEIEDLAGSEIGECICISGGIALEVPALSFVAVVNFGKLDIGAVAVANRTKGKICGTLSRERVFSIWNNDLVGVNLGLSAAKPVREEEIEVAIAIGRARVAIAIAGSESSSVGLVRGVAIESRSGAVFDKDIGTTTV